MCSKPAESLGGGRGGVVDLYRSWMMNGHGLGALVLWCLVLWCFGACNV